MNKISWPYSSSDRQDELQGQIFEASTSQQDKLLDVLQAQWVHRYGIETLPEETYSNSNKTRLIEAEQNTDSISNTQEHIIRKFADNKSFIYENEDLVESQSSDQSLKTKYKAESSSNSKEKNLFLLNTPPPTPSLSHLRKWLPNPNIETRKAS